MGKLKPDQMQHAREGKNEMLPIKLHWQLTTSERGVSVFNYVNLDILTKIPGGPTV